MKKKFVALPLLGLGLLLTGCNGGGNPSTSINESEPISSSLESEVTSTNDSTDNSIDSDEVISSSEESSSFESSSEVSSEVKLSVKEQLIEYVKHNEESYGVDNIEDIIKNIKDIPELLTEESYLYHVKDIIPKIDWEAIPIEKAYPYNAQVVSEMFINYVQPQIKNDFEERKKG